VAGEVRKAVAREGASSFEKVLEQRGGGTVRSSTDGGKGECNKQQQAAALSCGLREGEKEKRNKRLAEPRDMGYMGWAANGLQEKEGKQPARKKGKWPWGLNSFYDFLLFY
jgi:hypothetical protein